MYRENHTQTPHSLFSPTGHICQDFGIGCIDRGDFRNEREVDAVYGCPRSSRRTAHRHARISPALFLGVLLLTSGLLLMFLCIPGWAWAALAGALLIIAGYVLIAHAFR